MTWVFVGNISKDINKNKFESLLERYGKCRFDYKVKNYTLNLLILRGITVLLFMKLMKQQKTQ